MTGRSKGAWLGAAVIITIAVLWATVAGTHEDRSCVHWEPTPPGAFVGIGMIVGIPCAMAVGGLIGRAAVRIRRFRRGLMLIVAVLLACVLTQITGLAMVCCTDPTPSTLWPRAFLPIAIGISVLERWTRPEDPVPRAKLGR